MSKKGHPKFQKQLVRDVEKRNTKAFAQREVVVGSFINSKSSEKCNELSVAPNISKQASKEALRGNKDASKDAEAIINRKASKKLNFPFDEILYRGLIPLNDTKPTTSILPFKHLPRPPRKLDPAVEPIYNPHYPKHEFFFLQFGIKGVERSFQTSRKPIFGLPDCVKTFKDPKDYDGKEKKVTQNALLNIVPFEEDSSGLRHFRQLHTSLGIERPKLQYHFDGFGLHKKSQAWKL